MPGSTAVLIFDLDGTLADTSRLWREGEDALFAACGQVWDAVVQKQCLGMNARDLATNVHRLLQPTAEVEHCQRVMRDTLIDAYRRATDLPAIPGAVDLVRRLHGRVPMVVASGSPLEGIQAAVRSLGIADCFETLITSESVARGKPYPDVFLAAATAMKVEPARCCVFEDSLIGSQAAIAASMRCITRAMQDYESIAALGATVVWNWDEVTWSMINGADSRAI